ncbi:MAG: Sensory box histidine kinase/response regulator [uncultured Gemmatimonadetes bacterium]|uniref:histidine kinase n=1 Tax=uncultured Gemmatimonadota bacterium TaxID=203437 RepID=A0A6J4LRK9_9BACT|nr:MAG: Sensory box histidine kinase/response regulator [uncultured Gemmatimonadota bacterium]
MIIDPRSPGPGLPDSEIPDEAFDRFARLAAALLHAPSALVTVLGRDRQLFRGCVGMGETLAATRETPLTHSFCRYVIDSGEPLVVEDARRHPVLRGNPAVEEHGVVAYAGVPLATRGGRTVGSLCVISPTPRAWTGAEVAILRDLALSVAAEMEWRTEQAERRRTEEALGASESQLRAIFDEAAVGMAVVDLDGRLVRTNRALQSMLGYGADELHAMLFSEITHPDDVGTDWELFGDLVAGERTHYQVEKRYFRADGSILWTHLNVSLVRDAESAPCFTVGIMEDVTERRRAEEALRQSQDELLQAQKMETVGRLAGGVAHDFNNLLTVIKGNTQLLLAELPPGSPMREELEEIDGVSGRAADLTRQLLAFSRRQVLQPRVLDLNAAVADADRLLRRLLGEDVEFRTTLDPALGAVRADPGQLEQVLMNLAVNARDAMPRGGKLTLETRNVWLDAEYTLRHPSVAPGPYVMVAVSDTGHGMDAGTQARIFDPFFTTKEPGKGTGLGLATVYGIVRQSGGHVWVYSEVGRGTSFKVYLPRADEAPEPESALAGAELPRGTETILLVEDDDGVRRLARRVLSRAGYEVLEAPDGHEALTAAAAHPGPIHLVVTDVVMPGMSGREVAERMAAARPEAEVLYTSGYTDDAIVHHGVLDDGMAFLQKPFDPSTLLRAVRGALNRTVL